MNIQIVNFALKDLSDADYRRACEASAPAFAEVPGLLSKVWLADERTNTYGGVYTWVDRAAMEAYFRSDLFRAIAADPAFTDITSRDFDIIEGPTRVTSGMMAAPA
jgi:heme-degrading monooxygenase HmoA